LLVAHRKVTASVSTTVSPVGASVVSESST
jgi:hypothetical protein